VFGAERKKKKKRVVGIVEISIPWSLAFLHPWPLNRRSFRRKHSLETLKISIQHRHSLLWLSHPSPVGGLGRQTSLADVVHGPQPAANRYWLSPPRRAGWYSSLFGECCSSLMCATLQTSLLTANGLAVHCISAHLLLPSPSAPVKFVDPCHPRGILRAVSLTPARGRCSRSWLIVPLSRRSWLVGPALPVDWYTGCEPCCHPHSCIAFGKRAS
jgi:hypothetical protein